LAQPLSNNIIDTTIAIRCFAVFMRVALLIVRSDPFSDVEFEENDAGLSRRKAATPRRRFELNKRCQLFVGTESLSGVADNFAGIAEAQPAR
jgi:hypothetical protein